MAGRSDGAVILARDGARRPIEASEIHAAVMRGEVVLVPGVARRLGIVDEIGDLILAAVRERGGPELADTLQRLGLERIHEALDGVQIEAALHQAQGRLVSRYPSLTKRMGVAALGLTRPFYVHRSPMLRFMTPYDVTARNLARFTRDENLGRLHPHAPHQDHWFGVPINAINLWLAVSATDPDNGLSIFPDAWGAELEKEGLHARRDQYLGVPLRVACDPGDVVVFHSRHVHGSVLNTTGSTRLAITTRICVERPVAQSVNVLDGGCLYSPLVGTRFEPYATTATHVSWIYLTERAKERIAAGVTAIERRVGGPILPRIGRLARRALRYRRGDLAMHLPPALQRPAGARKPEELEEGEIAAVDHERCAARIGGEILVFGRRCPHENGDFAAGYVKDGRVHCPRHDYWIDPATGRGPCAAMAPVPTYSEERCRA